MKPSLPEVLEALILSQLEEIWTAIPGTVAKWNADGTINVTPGVPRYGNDGDGGVSSEALPELPSVPVCFPGGGGSSIYWAPTVGDRVLVVFCKSDPSVWWETGRPLPAPDTRPHHLAHGFAIPMQKNPGTALPGEIVITGGKIRVGGSDATHPAVFGDVLASWISAVASWIKTHTHATAALGPPVVPTEAALFPPTPSIQSSTVVVK